VLNCNEKSNDPTADELTFAGIIALQIVSTNRSRVKIIVLGRAAVFASDKDLQRPNAVLEWLAFQAWTKESC
jgi:hypothetical protein